MLYLGGCIFQQDFRRQAQGRQGQGGIKILHALIADAGARRTGRPVNDLVCAVREVNN